jgi:hypothetical protein
MGQEERAGGHLLTRDHEVIRQWAEQRNALPATTREAEADDRLGALRFDFEGGDERDLRPISWDEWLEEFDGRDLVFIYLQPSEGEGGNFFRLESAER